MSNGAAPPFEPDTAETPEEKNSRLADLLTHRWRYEIIETITRIDDDIQKGWLKSP